MPRKAALPWWHRRYGRLPGQPPVEPGSVGFILDWTKEHYGQPNYLIPFSIAASAYLLAWSDPPAAARLDVLELRD